MLSFLKAPKKTESNQALQDSTPNTDTSSVDVSTLTSTDVTSTTTATAASTIRLVEPAEHIDGPKIVLHFVRHAQAAHNCEYQRLTYSSRTKLTDPPLLAFGKLQCANFCTTFTRMDKVTHILCSPSQRAIATAKLAFSPLVTQRELPLVLMPQLMELAKNSPCNQGSPMDYLLSEHMFGKGIKFDFTYLNKVPGWQFTDSLAPSGILEVHVEEVRQMIYNMGRSFFEKGQVNAEENVEILVIGHAGKLGALMGQLEYEERKADRMECSEFRTFEWTTEISANAEDPKPWTIFNQVNADGLAHFPTDPFDCPKKKDLVALGWDFFSIASAEAGLRLYHMRINEEEAEEKKEAEKEDKMTPKAQKKLIAKEQKEAEKERKRVERAWRVEALARGKLQKCAEKHKFEQPKREKEKENQPTPSDAEVKVVPAVILQPSGVLSTTAVHPLTTDAITALDALNGSNRLQVVEGI